MSDRAARQIALAVVCATVALEATSIALTAGAGPLVPAVPYAMNAIVQAGAGAVVVWRYPRHPIGWILLLFALQVSLVGDAALAYGLRAAVEGWPWGPYAEITGLLGWIPGALGLVLLFLCVPDGRLMSPAWRAVVAVWAVGAALTVPGWALNPRLDSELAGGVNPLAVQSPWVEVLFVVGASLVSASVVASVVALLVRFRRSRGVERQQLKWIVLAGGVLAVVLPASAALWTAWPVIQHVAALALALLPIAMSVAIVRHHLYDVDLVISRTVAYAALTGVLAATYAAIVLTASAVLSSPVAAAAAALVVAVAVRPLRDRIQHAVDRRFRRARHESRQVMSEFVDRLRRGDVAADMVEDALRSAMHDDRVALAFRSGSGPAYDTRGHPRTLDTAPDEQIRTVVTSQQVHTLVRHRTGQERLLADVVDAGRLALEVAALQVELRRQLEELDASRARIVAVADEERRRLARNLHDGAQQRLVTIGLGLRHAQHALDGRAPAEVNRTLDRAVADLGEAIEQLRELAGGLRPTSLDAGLGAALRELAARSPIPVEVQAATGRVSGELETAAYFIACEGLTNAVKHARAGRVVLGVTRDDGDLVVTVDDDGAGGADPSRGSGLLGLADRARAHGGRLAIESSPDVGTTLTVRMPCE